MLPSNAKLSTATLQVSWRVVQSEALGWWAVPEHVQWCWQFFLSMRGALEFFFLRVY